MSEVKAGESSAVDVSYKDIQLLGEIGQQIAATLSVEEIIEKTYQNVNALMDASVFDIGIFNEGESRLDLPGGIEKGNRLPFSFYRLEDKLRPAVWCFEKQQEFFTNNYKTDYPRFFDSAIAPESNAGEDTVSLIYLPLSMQGKRIGVITVQSFSKDAYTAYHVTLLRNMALYVATALENARLYETMEKEVRDRTREVQKQKEELEHSNKNMLLLGEIGQQITATLSVEEIARKTYKNLNALMDASVFSIGIFEKEKNGLYFPMTMEKGSNFPPYTYSLEDTHRISVSCFLTQREIIMNDYAVEYPNIIPNRTIPTQFYGEQPKSLIYIPLTVHGKQIGVISVQSFHTQAYTNYHVGIVRNLAAYVSIAIENARLYETMEEEVKLRTQEVVRQKVELEKLSIVASKSEHSILICDTRTELLWANEAFTRTFGYTLEEFKKTVGKTIIEISSNPNIKELLEECVAKRTGVVYESKNETRYKGQRHFQTALSPVFDDSGVLQNIVFMDSDITALKVVEEQLQEKNKEIMDSIYYAERIQRALFASDYYIRKHLPDYFIFFQPKDVVSGDFYWMLNKNECTYVVTADCTGHGVPGAFMSMMGINLLNDIVMGRNTSNPGLILDIMREEIIHNLNPEGAVEESKDGMDMVLCKFDLKNNILEFAAANNSLYLLRDGKLTEYPGDKMPVGVGSIGSFTKQTLQLQKGDKVYTFTDGFPDQFGGPKGKKYKYKQLEELLRVHAAAPMAQQQQILQNTFDTWKGSLDQVDDVLVMGISI